MLLILISVTLFEDNAFDLTHVTSIHKLEVKTFVNSQHAVFSFIGYCSFLSVLTAKEYGVLSYDVNIVVRLNSLYYFVFQN
jgi:hypothetical protein